MIINEIQLELGKQQEDMTRLLELTKQAAEFENLEGMNLIATNYPMMVANILNDMELSEQALNGLENDDLIKLYSRTKKHLNYKIRKKMLEKIIPFITKKAKSIFERGISSSVSRYVGYQPGDFWEVEMTLEKMIGTGKTSPDYETIVVKEPSKRKRSIVICIDKSLSVLQLIHQIVLMASVLSLSVKKENFAIIEFDSEATVIKKMSHQMNPEKLVEMILNIESGGKTNIEEALNLALKELLNSRSREKIVYLISDLERTVGKNPLLVITQIKDLRVIYARTYRRVSFVDKVLALPNVLMEELNPDSDLVELTSKMIS